MAEKRRVQMEMDKCFKKIDEQVDVFDEMMRNVLEMGKQPITSIHHESHREKMQDELKREIKKIQRLREQVRAWENNDEIKEKNKLNTYRRLIEQRMKAFQEVECENKTKPHSNQGLSAEEKLDPQEKEKTKTLDWLKTCIRKIKDEIDRTESKIEAAGETDGKRCKRDDLKKDNQKKLAALQKHLQRTTYHDINLEVCMRLIMNDKLESAVVLALLKEPLDMYMEALESENEYDLDTLKSLEPDGVYAELHLDDYSLLPVAPPVKGTPRPLPPVVEKAPPKPVTTTTKWVAALVPFVRPPALPKPAPVVVGGRGPSYAAVAACESAATVPKNTKVTEISGAVNPSQESQEAPAVDAEKKMPDELLVKAAELPQQPLVFTVKHRRRPVAAERPPRASVFTQTGCSQSSEPKTPVLTPETNDYLRRTNAQAARHGNSPQLLAFRPPYRISTSDRATQTGPQRSPVYSNSPEDYEKMGVEALFSWFYHPAFLHRHVPVTQELEKRGWRYHLRDGVWFLRVGSVLEFGADYERAPFLTNCSRKWKPKLIEDFCFDYRYLQPYY